MLKALTTDTQQPESYDLVMERGLETKAGERNLSITDIVSTSTLHSEYNVLGS